MVDLNGLEPSTSRLSGVRSNQLSYRSVNDLIIITKIIIICQQFFNKNGGLLGIRTLDPLIKSQLLYQLS